MSLMEFIKLYKCLCDTQRLRILNLLQAGPLCVCHLEEILGADQVKISKQLKYMKELGMVRGERVAQWMMYQLAEPENPLLRENLKCLQDSYGEHVCFALDQEKRQRITQRLEADDSPCARALQS